MPTSKIITEGNTSKMRCPHFETCRRAVTWRNDLATARAHEERAYSWFNHQTIRHTHRAR